MVVVPRDGAGLGEGDAPASLERMDEELAEEEGGGHALGLVGQGGEGS